MEVDDYSEIDRVFVNLIKTVAVFRHPSVYTQAQTEAWPSFVTGYWLFPESVVFRNIHAKQTVLAVVLVKLDVARINPSWESRGVKSAKKTCN